MSGECAFRYSEDELLPISALQHMLFCEWQTALIHLEGLWQENRLTVEGRHLHQRAHEGPDEARNGVRVTRGLALRSFVLGLTGRADVVEFHGDEAQPFPVEYKRGRPKQHAADKVQLCAQGMCLEEMLRVTISGGSIFYGRMRRRLSVAFDEGLRILTADTALRLHDLMSARRTPPARREPKCDDCSLLELCMPGSMSEGRIASRYFAAAIHEVCQ